MLVGLRSRRHIAPFAVHRPTTLDEALALRRQPGPSAFLAGGIDLIDWLKQGNAIDRLIRLDGIPGLADITATGNDLRIGALATHSAILESPVVQDTLPDLATLWHQIANPRVRFAGTIGGNVMARRPDYDGLPALLALGAEADTTAGRVPVDRITDLVSAFVIPDPAGLRLFTDRSLKPAISVWFGMTLANDHVEKIRVATSMAHPIPTCVTLTLDMPVTALAGHAASIAETVVQQTPAPITDTLATAGYRQRMLGVLTRRLLIRAGGAL
jgi:aerobic carbon-monoxide dehydrogenase medium subunit